MCDTVVSGSHPVNQLDRVICQLTFYPMLKIGSGVAAFQSELRGSYPDYHQDLLAAGMGTEPMSVSHRFSAEDNRWAVTLTASSVALETSDYRTWEDFSQRIARIIGALQAAYPDIREFTRVGLRYVNAIRRSSLNLGGCAWSRLIAAPAIAPLGLGGLTGFGTTMEFAVDTAGTQARTSVGTIVFHPGDEEGFLIDDDVFTAVKQPCGQAMACLQSFHRRSEEIFCRLTTPELQQKVGIHD